MKIWWVYLDVGTGNYVHYNHGVGQIDACLRQEGHQSELLYLREHLEKEDFQSRLRQVSPDAVFFPINTHQWVDAPRYAQWVKDAADLPCVFGGIHGILDAENVFQNPVVDVLCIGEGEEAMVEWCRAMQAGKQPQGIRNLWIRRPGGDIERNPMRPLIENLESLPIDDREMWDHDWILRDSLGEVGIMGGRGCPYSCTYCANSARREKYEGLGRFVRMSSPEHLIDTVEHIRPRIPFRKIFFEDDIFTMDHDWVHRFCELYKERFDVPFKIYIHVETVTKEVLRELKEAGCYMVMAGVEAGNEALRKALLNRHMTNEDLIKVFRWCDELGLQTWTFNMVGFPGETEQTIQDLFVLHRSLRPNGAQCSLFYPYPGTKLHQVCREQGLLTGEERPTYFEKSVLNIESVSKERLERAFWDFRTETLQIKASKEARGVYDLLANLSAAEVAQQDENEPVRLHLAKIDGDERLCLFAHPRCDCRWKIRVPPDGRFRAAVALDPLCIDWGGRGAHFVVKVNGQERFAQYVDPKWNQADRRWHEIAVDCSDLAGTEIRLALCTEPYATGDLTGVWALWANPRLET